MSTTDDLIDPEDFLVDGPDGADTTIVLAHGAGAPMDSPFMEVFAAGLASKGHRVVRFEFPYMAVRRQDGRRRPPNKAEVLREAWLRVITHLASKHPGSKRLVIGGKSMGGRIASLVADESQAKGLGVRGLVCLGYPFHPPGRPEKLRTAHLTDLATPCLIVQGTRDSFGTAEEVPAYGLASSIRLHWALDGNHDLVPRKSSGHTAEGNWQDAIAAIDDFVNEIGV